MKKKNYFFVFVLFFFNYFVFAQKSEIVKIFKFNEPFAYYEEGTEESLGCGISKLFVRNGKIFIKDCNTQIIYDANNLNDFFGPKILGSGTFLDGDSNFVTFHRGNGPDDNINLNIQDFQLLKPEYILMRPDEFDYFYLTENKFFTQNDNNELIYWDLLDNGKSVFHDESDTKRKLNEGLGELIGLRKDSQFFNSGDNCMSRKTLPTPVKIKNVRVVTEKYSHVQFYYGMSFLDNDERGFSYLQAPTRSLVNKDQKINVSTDRISYIVLDPWLLEAYVIDLDDCDFTPPKKNGRVIPVLASCVDEEGNIYFTDCNKEKQQYEIKKLSNEWLKQYDFFNREIGRMNSNHIELRKAPDSSTDFDGYNFEHDYLWILEHGKEWSKVRKIDGREGWVENKYINFSLDDKNKEKKVLSTFRSKISKNQIMVVSENLRLRETEISTSNIITTMKSGTKVRVLELGKIEQIDDKTEHWVKVEIIGEGKDRNNNPIAYGTIGWCFGGYLE